jgi:hypothetical protein
VAIVGCQLNLLLHLKEESVATTKRKGTASTESTLGRSHGSVALKRQVLAPTLIFLSYGHQTVMSMVSEETFHLVTSPRERRLILARMALKLENARQTLLKEIVSKHLIT